MHNEMPDHVMSWKPGEVRLLDGSQIGAGYLGAIHQHDPDGTCPAAPEIAAPPVVFVLMDVTVPGTDGQQKETINLVVSPTDAAMIGLRLVDVGTAAMSMPRMAEAPVDIVDR